MCVDPTGKEEAPKDIDVPFVSGQQCHEYPYWNEVEMEEFGGKRQGRANILNASSYQELGINTWCMSYHLDWFEDAVEAGLLTKENTGLPIGDYCSAEFAGPEGYQYGITYRRNDFFKDLAEGSERCLAGWAKVNPAWKEIYDKYFTRQYYYSGRCGPPSNALAMLMTATRHRGQPNDSMGHFTGYSKQLRGFLPQAVMDEAQKAVRAKWAPLLGPKSFDIGDEPKTFEGKVPVVIFFQNMDIEGDSIPYCRWMGFPRWYSIWTPDHVGDPGVGAKMLAAVTGIERTMEENVNSFEAAFTLERAILVREGLRREHDWYNDLTFEKNKDWTSKEEFNKVLDEYYTARGWDVATGIPTRSQLEKLGMKDVADDLESKYGVKVPA
jgi:aldehyde:ferredoxin oxidoreductase